MRKGARWSSKLAAMLTRAFLLSGVPLVVATSVAYAAPLARPNFDIKAGSLAEELRAFAEQSQAQVLYTPGIVDHRRGQAVKGQYSPAEALDRLLGGTGLRFILTPQNVFLVSAESAKSSVVEVPAVAQPQAAPQQAPPEMSQTVVITGTKGPGPVAPASVATTSTPVKDLDRVQVRDFDDLIRIAPSITISKTTQPANNSINIRGVGTYAYSVATESSVAVVIDDIPQAFQAAAFSALVDVKQVDILKGPQGTASGRSASSGIVSITTQPVSRVFSSQMRSTVTDDREYRLQGMVSGPITPTLGFRLAANYSSYQGNIFNLATKHWLNGQIDRTVRAKLEWQASPDLTLTFLPYANATKSSCCVGAEVFVSPGLTYAQAGIPQSVILAGIRPNKDNRLIRMDVDATGDATDYGAGLKAVRQFKALRFTAMASYERYKLVDMQDADSSAFDFSTIVPGARTGGAAVGGFFKIDSVTGELKWTSLDGARVQYVAGLVFNETRARRFFVRGSNALETYGAVQTLPTTNSTFYSSYLSDAVTRNVAGYAQATVPVTERLKAVGGLRINRQDISYTFDDFGNGITFGAPRCSSANPSLPISTCNADTAVSGRLGVFRTGPRSIWFANYTRGAKGLAYDLTSTLTIRTPIQSGPDKGLPFGDVIAARQPVRPEIVDNYEAGFGRTFFDRRTAVKVTAFSEIFRHFQAQSHDFATGINILNSIGKVSSRGMEAEVSSALGEHFGMKGAMTYNEAVMVNFPNATCFPSQTVSEGCIGGLQDLSGKPLFNAPRWNANLDFTYEGSARGQVRPFATLGYRWQSSVIFNLLQDPDSVQKSYGLLNLSGGLRAPGWSITLFVQNLFDQRYALTRSRDVQWNLDANAQPPTDSYSWKPGRDSRRYVGLRLTAAY